MGGDRMGQGKSLARYWLPVILLCSAIFISSSFPSVVNMQRVPQGDKLLHATVYGILAALFFRAFNALEGWHRKPARTFLFSLLAAGIYGLSDEWHQSFVVGRTADAMDWIANMLGATLAAGWYLTALRKRRRTDHT
jgi:VanZ family protein